jgi:hypothetical protein
MLVVEIHPTWRLEERGVEGPEPMPDVLQLESHTESHGRGKHRVLDVMHSPALQRGGNQVSPEQRDVGSVIVDRDHLAFDP